jgi:plastocyanin
MLRRYAVSILVTLIVALVLGACATPGDGDLTPRSEPSLVPLPRAIVIEAAEYSFTPNTFTAPIGEVLTFEILNTGTLEHNFVVLDPLGVEVARTSAPITVGGMGSVELQVAEAGTYTIVCDIPGHQEAGMQASLTVNSAAASSGTTQ